MASKTKRSKTYIVHHRGHSQHGGYTTLGRYRVGAKNEKEAEMYLRNKIGKHHKVRVYYEEKEKLLSNGVVIKE